MEFFVTRLPALMPSPECQEVAISYLCYHYFGVCSGDGTLYKPSANECNDIIGETGTCGAEFMRAAAVVPPEMLPVCNSLLNTVLLQCSADNDTTGENGKYHNYSNNSYTLLIHTLSHYRNVR